MDDLTKIKGIGKGTAEKLVAAGFATYAALAAASAEALAEIAPSPEVAAEWVAAAATLAEAPPTEETEKKKPGKAKAGLTCKSEVRWGGKTYRPGDPLPADFPADEVRGLKARGFIEE
jgi:NAD(P)-dependent dehydrogenase (short-subunit alcohol dehydrogenase family)